MISCFRFSFKIIFVCFLISSCAIKVAPQGGKTDSVPPKAVEFSPANFSNRFDSKKIEIAFDEFFQLKDLNGQLVVSPIISREPEITVKNKSIVIKLDGPLSPNTTYSINFGNAIADVHENNVLENFRYVFSTGDFVDSLSLSGKVMNAKNHSLEKSVLVMLYRNYEDSVPLKEKPYYFTKTNAEGIFKIENMASGNYKAFALKDANSNYLYDLPNELIGFSDSLIKIDTNKTELKLFLFGEESPKQQFVKSYSESYGKINLVYKKPIQNLSIKNSDNTVLQKFDFAEYSLLKDTVTYWIGKPESDTLNWIVAEGEATDTLKFIMKKNDGKTGSKGTVPHKLIAGNNSTAVSENTKLEFSFNHPVKEFDFSKIGFEEDSVAKSDFTLSFKDSIHKRIEFGYLLKENKNYNLVALPGTFKDIFGLENDTLKFNFKPKEAKEYGTIALSLTLPEKQGNYILQLMNESENILKEDFISSSQKINYSWLNPGKYKLKLIVDSNKNNRWDTGNYLKNIQPEKVSYNNEVINVKSNWDLDLQWKAE